MIYGDEKRRQMARSLLPSKSGKRAKAWQQRIKRAARRKSKMDLREARACGGEAPDRVDLRAYPDAEIRLHVAHRRDADKLAPFYRWSQAVTADLPPEDRLSAIRSAMPEGVIGEHALGHLEWLEHFQHPREGAIQALRLERYRRRDQGGWSRAQRRALLRVLLEDGALLGMLNRALRERHRAHSELIVREIHVTWIDARRCSSVREDRRPIGPQRARTLRGPGDVEAFLDALDAAARPRPSRGGRAYSAREVRVEQREGHEVRAERVIRCRCRRDEQGYHPEWGAALDTFLSLCVAHGGDRGAIRRALPASLRADRSWWS